MNVMTTHMAQKLGLKQTRTAVTYTGIARTRMPRPQSEVTLDLWCPYKSEQLQTTALVPKTITYNLPTHPFDKSSLKQMEELHLADPDFNIPGPIDLLIGVDLFETIVLNNKFQVQPRLHVRETLCGWVLSGTLYSDQTKSTLEHKTARTLLCNAQTLHFSSPCNDSQADKLLTRFWEIEDIPTSPERQLSAEEKACEDFFIQTTTRDTEGRYIVKLPFKPDAQPLGDSFSQAKRRLLSVERRLANHPQKQAYVDFMNGFIDAGHLERVPSDELFKLPHDVYYLPHHHVVKESSTTTKLRIVFDASAVTTNGTSLNDSLMTGPTLQDNLCDILLRFRFHVVALSADVEKMYRQIGLHPSSRDYHRILWRDQPCDPIQTWRMTRVTYGVRSSAHHAIKSSQAVGKESEHANARQVILRDFVVDDMLSGAPTVDEARQLQDALQSTLQCAGMRLRKWSSNKPEAICHMPAELKEAPEAYEIHDHTHQIKVLGVHWSPLQDVFHFTVSGEGSFRVVKTKRQMLSDIAKLYDPLGWLSPVIIRFKILVQQTWVAGVAWDDDVPPNILESWLSARTDLPNISRRNIPRCVLIPNQTETTMELHVFCDASEVAYGAVIYSRVKRTDGTKKVSLLTSKSRVAPIKTLTLPRLELCAAALGSQLLRSTINALQSLPITITEIIGWTDSTTVLSWLASYPGTWSCFVGNRVALIQEQIPPSQWKHVSSDQNPADCVSRGLTASEMISFDLWWQGPSWLSHCDSSWPHQPSIPTTAPPEKRKRPLTGSHLVEKRAVIDFDRFSNFNRLQRTLVFVLRFLDSFSGLSPIQGPIQQSELVKARSKLVTLHQKQFFGEDLKNLAAHTRMSQYHGRLLSLSPFFDEELSIIRVGGRLGQGSHDTDATYPAIIAGKSHFATLLIRKAHADVLHGGPQATLYELRRHYWIIDGPRCVQRVIRGCTTCRRFMARAEQPRMGDLPAERVTPSRPFTKTGLDFAGPLTLKSSMSRSTQKAYIFIFVCFATKAVHIELVSALTSAACIGGLKRFVARRGLPSTIFSDNGSNFIGARNELNALQDLLSTNKESSLSAYAATRGVEWVTIPPRAPHFGGLWEAAVKSCKILLRRSIGLQALTFEELSTVLAHVEACLNSRPLTPMSHDPNDMEVLSPGHFLIGAPLHSLPTESSNAPPKARFTLHTRWKLVQQIHDSFWSHWYKEYLSNLQQRHKWKLDTQPLQVSDLVLIKEDRVPPLHWPRARILNLYTGNDGTARVARVQTANGIFTRPLTKLVKLFFDE